MIWFLVMADVHLGPLSEDQCKMAEAKLRDSAVMCMKADYMYYCSVEGKPGVGKSCPHFTYPQIKLKEDIR